MMTVTLQIVQKMRDKAAMASAGVAGGGLASGGRAASTNSIFIAAKDALAIAKLASSSFAGAEVVFPKDRSFVFWPAFFVGFKFFGVITVLESRKSSRSATRKKMMMIVFSMFSFSFGSSVPRFSVCGFEIKFSPQGRRRASPNHRKVIFLSLSSLENFVSMVI